MDNELTINVANAAGVPPLHLTARHSCEIAGFKIASEKRGRLHEIADDLGVPVERVGGAAAAAVVIMELRTFYGAELLEQVADRVANTD